MSTIAHVTESGMDPTLKPVLKRAPTQLVADGAARLPSPRAQALHTTTFIAFLLCFTSAWVELLPGVPPNGFARLIWVPAAATSLVGLARRLPAQNVLMSGLLIAAVAFGFSVADVATGIPFGRRDYTGALGSRLLGVPWSIPLMWLAIIVNGRGVARLILRPWRDAPDYGFRVIGLTGLLALSFDAALEPFATRVGSYWGWEAAGAMATWYSAPWTNFPAWLVVALVILAVTTPWLINKRPVRDHVDDHPLAVWLLLNVYFLTGLVLHQLWPAVAMCLILNSLATVCALRGRRA
jgi:uncharacterized membrane protein